MRNQMSELTESSRIIGEAWSAYVEAEGRLERHARYNSGACTLGDKCTICAKNMAREKERMDEARMTVAWEYGWSFRNSEMAAGGVNLS